MRRRHLLVAAGSALVGAGCTGLSDPSNVTQTDSSTPTDATNTQQTLEHCEVNSLDIINWTDDSVTVTVILTALGGRYRGRDSPTATEGATPLTETPEEMFSESFELGTYQSEDDTKSYSYIKQRKTGGHRLDVSLQHGSENSFLIDLPYRNNMGFQVDIKADGIMGSRKGVC